jgi:hypothetical protein
MQSSWGAKKTLSRTSGKVCTEGLAEQRDVKSVGRLQPRRWLHIDANGNSTYITVRIAGLKLWNISRS